MTDFDHILLIGFGGPEKKEDVMPFLRRVAAGRNIPDARLKAAAHHYDQIGGKSSYNAWAARLQKDITAELEREGIHLPVFLGLRNAAPFLKDTLLEIHKQGLQNGVGVILAPFRSPASCRRYKENMHDVLHESGIINMRYAYLPAWYQHPKWIGLLADLTKAAIEKIPGPLRSKTEILFSCHSIPLTMDKDCPDCIYSAEYETACLLTAQAVGLTEWKHVYQSRSGDPEQPWLGPDILEAMEQAAAAGKKAVCVIPMGFLSDNAEVLYDLDIEAKATAEKLGLQFYRAATPGHDSRLVKLFAKMIGQVVKTGQAHNTCAV